MTFIIQADPEMSEVTNLVTLKDRVLYRVPNTEVNAEWTFCLLQKTLQSRWEDIHTKTLHVFKQHVGDAY